MAKICIIPARGGSKRIPRKNIKMFLGKPIIAYSIQAALASNLFDEVMVSTDDEEIAKIAREYGANVPFLRSQECANDFATTRDVVSEVIRNYEKLEQEYELTCVLYPTAPFVTNSKINSAFKMMTNRQKDAAYTVCEFSYPVQRGLHFVADHLKMKWPENLTRRSQDLEKMYHDAGQFYMFDTQKYLTQGGVFKMNSTAIIVSELEVQDIDTETDWKLAEMKYNLALLNRG